MLDHALMEQRPAALCMPLLRGPVQLTPAEISQAWSEVWPGRPGPSNFEVKGGAFTCQVDGAVVGGMVMPAPIPNDELAGPASTSWLWPTASQDLQGYSAHVVVFVSQAGSHLAAFHAMTRMTAAVVRASNALGVYMGGAGTVIRADVFVGMAQEMEMPVALWLDLRCVASRDGRTGLFTVGLKQFGLMEIEIPSSSQKCGDLRIWTMSLASWLIETRPTINSGETVGLTADERIPVEHAQSMINREGPVMRLTGI
jgi:uncharacterized protein DUF4261